MTDEFWLGDIDTPTAADDAGWLEVTARFPDGTSSCVHYTESEGDIPEIAETIINDDIRHRVAQLSPADRDVYYECNEPNLDDVFGSVEAGCGCRAACFCYDRRAEIQDDIRYEAFEWLAEQCGPGAIVTWRWGPSVASGTSILVEPFVSFAPGEIVLKSGSGERTRATCPEDYLPEMMSGRE